MKIVAFLRNVNLGQPRSPTRPAHHARGRCSRRPCWKQLKSPVTTRSWGTILRLVAKRGGGTTWTTWPKLRRSLLPASAARERRRTASARRLVAGVRSAGPVRDYVIRFGRAHAEDFAKDRLAARYACPGLPIPAIIELGEVGSGYYAISERVFGGYIDDADEAQMPRPSALVVRSARRRPDRRPFGDDRLWARGADGNASFPSWRAALLGRRRRPASRPHPRLARTPGVFCGGRRTVRGEPTDASRHLSPASPRIGA